MNNVAEGMGKFFFADGRYYEGEFNNGKIVNEENIVMKHDNNLIDNDLEFNNNIDINNMNPNKENINDNNNIIITNQ